MPSLPSWLSSNAPASAPVPGTTPYLPSPYYPRINDPNVPDHRLQLTSKCIYERQLPGGSYITAHVERLQCGYYDSPVIHEDLIANIRFLAVRFVFHEASTEHRFKAATIRLGLHDESARPEGIPLPPQLDHPNNDHPPERMRSKPKFLRHAPHLLYGAMSPETLDWNFNLAGSLGVAQTPVSASINPSAGIKSSYKVYKMMKIQGSIRTNTSWYGKHYDLEDGELVWTLEENELQKSGLPREFTFVLMLTKGSNLSDVRLDIDVEPEVASWFGSFPRWYIHMLRFQPLYKEPLDLDKEIGQKFEPVDGIMGFNFAGLMSTFDNFVTLPGTLYSTQDWSASTAPSSGNKQSDNTLQQGQATAPPSKDSANPNNTVHLRIHLDNAHRQGIALTASTYPYPESTSKAQKSPKASPASHPPSKQDSSQKQPDSRSSKPARRVTINGEASSVPSKQRYSRIPPLQTHYEEQHTTSPKPQSSPGVTRSPQEYEYSFPESMYPPTSKSTQSSKHGLATANHRHTVSASTASSSAIASHQIISLPVTEAGAPTTKTALSSHPSLRRSRSRSGLRSASFTSQPEDEEAISAAMDMLSGSPPPPSPVPPKLRMTPPTTMSLLSDTLLATPRTRATLADLMEVEQAENARIQRRHGNTKPDNPRLSRDHSTGRSQDPGNKPSNSLERERKREKRYSMPVASTGIGYSGTGGHFNAQDDSLNMRSGQNGVKADRTFHFSDRPTGNGRSSLMIPIGSKRDSGLGIGGARVTGNQVSFPERDDDSGVSSV